MPLIKKPVMFRDLIARDELARTIAADEKKTLELRGPRGDEEQATLKRLKLLEALPKATPVDPLFVALRAAFNADAGTTVGNPIGEHTGGKLEVTETDDEINFSLVMGNLQVAGVTPPKVDTDGAKVFPLDGDPDGPPFVQAFYRALGKARASFDLAKLVLPILKAEGKGKVITREFAEVMRYLSEKGVTVKELQLNRRVNEALDQVQQSQINPPIEDLTIEIPDFNLKTEYQIQAKNVEAFGPLICAAMLDELKAFEVVDKLVELSQAGMLPTGLGGAGRILYEYWKQTPTRMSDSERRNFYALTMGIPGGSVNGAANRDFNDLWIRFVSSVSNLVRQRTTDFLLRAPIPGSLNQQQVRKSARDLALNLSSHGYGMVSFAARDLQLQINTMIKLLDNKEVRNAYGARDMWQVIDQVAALELGGARNSARYRTLATCGAIITKWLSQNIQKFNSATSSEKVIDVIDVLSADPRSSGTNATSTPTDYDLVNACELWLADTAVSEDGVREYSQPRESPVMTSRPVQIPAIAKEILSQSLPPGLGFGVNRR